MSQKKNNQKKKDSSSGSSQQWQQDQELAAILGDLQALTGGKGSAFDYRKASQSKVELRSINLDEDEDEQEEDAESVGDEADVMEWEEGSVSASEGEAEEDTLLAEEEETSTKKRKDIESSEAETVAKKSKVTTATEEAVVEGEVKKSNKQLKKEKRLLERAQKQLDQQQPSTDITNTAKGTTETTATEGVEGGTSSWNFEVDYNDHFETPAIAYSDVLSLLDQLSTQLNKSKAELIIYDPYYCLGNMKAYLQQLGFINVINENRDFYKDIRTKKLPNYDILLTNPPYSGEHKIKLMQYLMSSTHANRPFALLLPLYTITKSYWKDYVTYANNVSKIICNFLSYF